MSFTITSEQIVWFLGIVGGIYTVYRFYKELKKPKDDLKEMVERHEEKLNNDNEKLIYLEQAVQLILQCNLVMIEHDITQNGYPQLEKARDDLHEFLIKK